MLKKKLWHMCTNFWINPHNGKLPSRLAPAQCQNSLTPQLLSNIYWSKTKTSISLNRVYWYDTMCHIFSCLNIFWFWVFLARMVVRCKLKIMSLGIIVRHLSASIVMPKSYPRDEIINPHLATIKDSYSPYWGDYNARQIKTQLLNQRLCSLSRQHLRKINQHQNYHPLHKSLAGAWC